MNQQVVAIAADVIARMPEWIRNDLASKDAALRTRAEDALAAMIASALNENSGQSTAAE